MPASDFDPRPVHSPAFQALDGVRFWPGGTGVVQPYVFRVSWYVPQPEAPGWEPAIVVWMDNGEPVDKVTVRLAEETHGPDQFFVTVHGSGRAAFNQMLLDTGIFENLGHPRASGYVLAYAETWTFRRNKDGRALIELPQFREKLEQRVVGELEKLLAREAAARLGAPGVRLPMKKRGEDW